MPSQWDNPFDAAYYKDYLAPYETDGFPEWATPAGFTLAELTLAELFGLVGALFLFFIVSTFSAPAAVILCGPVIVVILAGRIMRKRYGRSYLRTLLWKAGLVPPDGFYPFDPVPQGQLRKMNLRYERRVMP